MDIAAFLLARIAEVEADARAAIESDLDQWAPSGHEIRFVSPTSLRGDGLGAVVAFGVAAKPVPHIARWDPAHVLAWCAAVRAVCDFVEACMTDAVSIVAVQGTVHIDRRILRLLAQPFASHVDYDPDWRPAT